MEGHFSNCGAFIPLSLVPIIEPGYELEDPSPIWDDSASCNYSPASVFYPKWMYVRAT
jgi:hypothetical protein